MEAILKKKCLRGCNKTYSLQLNNMTEGKLIALLSMLNNPTTVLQQEVGDAVRRSFDAANEALPSWITGK